MIALLKSWLFELAFSWGLENSLCWREVGYLENGKLLGIKEGSFSNHKLH